MLALCLGADGKRKRERATATARTLTRVSCHLGRDGLNPELSRCLATGRVFLKHYMKRVHRARRKPFDRCSESLKFRSCITPYIEECENVKAKLHHHWGPVVATLNAACTGDRDLVRAISCFETEYNGVLVHQCDEYYRFNVRQGTHGSCHFLHLNLRCKQELVASACGVDTGLFAFHFSKLLMISRLRKSKCFLPKHHNFKLFKYGNECPRNLTGEIDQCTTTHLGKTVLLFHRDNDLVADGGTRDLKRACRDFKKFKECLHPLKKACGKGIDMIYDYDGRLRTYLLKMEYICSYARPEYMAYLPCYQSVVRNETLFSCMDIWQNLRPLLDNTTSYQFYCLKTHANTHLLRSDLGSLRRCYEGVFSQSCGSRSATVIGELIKKAFEDPRYLRFKYRADCSLHDAPPDVDVVAAQRVRPSSTSGASSRKRTTLGTRVTNHVATDGTTSGESRTVMRSGVLVLSFTIVLWRSLCIT